jgi:hypothetical protein
MLPRQPVPQLEVVNVKGTVIVAHPNVNAYLVEFTREDGTGHAVWLNREQIEWRCTGCCNCEPANFNDPMCDGSRVR